MITFVELWVVQNKTTGHFLTLADDLPMLFHTREEAESEALEVEDGDNWQPTQARLSVTASEGPK